MSFSTEWEDIYQSGAHESIWPWSDVVSLTHRYLRKKEGKKVLELGCGAGANIPFYQSIGVRYYGIEGSVYQADLLKNRFQDENVTIVSGDFTKEIPFDTDFDLILDRGSLTCNSTDDIKNAIDMIYEKLCGGGIHWYRLVY